MRRLPRAFVLGRIRHLAQLILWACGLYVVLKMIGSYDGSKFDLQFDESDRKLWFGGSIGVIIMWVGITILQFWHLEEEEANASLPSEADEDS